MNELALFAGIGGGILGGHLLGWKTVAACEIEDYPRETLLRRQLDGILPKFPIWDDINTLDGKQFRGKIDIVSGGFPCQDISAAGKGAGIDGVRSGLWKQMHRIIDEVRPRFAFMENSPLLTSRGLGTVLGDLAEIGYDAEWCVLGADDIGAPHRRKRIWILGYPVKTGLERFPRDEYDRDEPGRIKEEKIGSACPGSIQWWDSDPAELAFTGCEHGETGNTAGMETDPGQRAYGSIHNQSGSQGRIKWWDKDPADVSDTDSLGQVQCEPRARQRPGILADGSSPPGSKKDDSIRSQSKEWSIKPVMGRVAHGLVSRVDRLKAIGNGQVPGVAAIAFLILQRRIQEELWK
ncbi:DNA cytosine methyltransferase [Oceanispirochaeta sp.]|jgi:DNA (cytosine-5)-methyltransferase 1|uniref:DNA cytosine methyltransferase n=1 Tax=Oceanispirochaeta sp. TaxID=2035350 RepID=UPI00260FE4F9|nr:DNA cytosine methyltransferase [Oceanispirochaeta sp.]MDA3957335.1 DNA cytosine methyltransferase [Oceanispirochaeta sp.]